MVLISLFVVAQAQEKKAAEKATPPKTESKQETSVQKEGEKKLYACTSCGHIKDSPKCGPKCGKSCKMVELKGDISNAKSFCPKCGALLENAEATHCDVQSVKIKEEHEH